MPGQDELWDFGPRDRWDPEWTGSIEIEDSGGPRGRMSGRLAWAPYGLVGLLLVLTRLRRLPFHEWLGWSVEWNEIFGSAITAQFQPLLLPGTVFIVVSLATLLLHRLDLRSYATAWTASLKTTVAASVALAFTVPMVQVFINTGGGVAGYERMPIVLADGVAALAGSAWPIFAPLIGGLGAFVAGSNTVSNMMFSLFQFGVGERIGVDPSWVVALQAVGGAAGNMICVHNVVAASAVVGLLGKEGAVIRKTFVPFLYYALLPGVLGYLIL
jgi:lactate permease